MRQIKAAIIKVAIIKVAIIKLAIIKVDKEQRLAKCSEKAPLLQRVLVGPGCGI